ncbi:MAG: phosphatase PAP2 family protein [Gemmatimonadetes bacterium]|nr:phosphatase PAP2 family protein [Gemmatimonadota bacterium]
MLSILGSVPLRAQAPVAADSAHREAPLPLFTWRDAALAGGFGAVTVAMFPIDRRVARHLQDSSTQANRFFRNGSKSVQYIADPGAVIIGVSLYGVGRLAHWREVADLGLHGTEAVAVSGAVTTLLKGVVGRARPYVSSDTTPSDFHFGRGFRNGAYQSFPSGHTTVAFAAAAVVTSESAHWGKRAVWLVAPAMYGGATLVGLSRMYNNAHWASDVALGAAIGTFSGIKVVRFNHTRAHDRLDRWLLGAEITPAPDGRVAVGWSVEP